MRSSVAVRVLWATLPVIALLPGCSSDERSGAREPQDAVIEDPGPVHVHGLGVNPRDGALFIATHTGLFRAAEGERTATRVKDRYQDTMGFTVTGPDRFLGSGHPDAREGLPPYLGLIRSTDAGGDWQPVSLLGKADFHVLEASGRRVVGFGSDFESRRAQLLVSDDGGRTWAEREPPEPLVDLAISPENRDELVASGERGLHRSLDGGRTWRELPDGPGLLGWSPSGELYRVAADGEVSRSRDGGRSWQARGGVGAQPAAFLAEERRLYVALHDGTIKQSDDGGRSWTVHSRPRATRRAAGE